MGVCCALVPAAGLGDDCAIAEDVGFDEGECVGKVFDAPRLEEVE
jgi:hypothetical protein